MELLGGCSVRFIGIALAVITLSGCVTNDFAVVNALRPGMTREEASQAIGSYGFQRESVASRPGDGWSPSRDGFAELSYRAGAMEKHLQKTIYSAETYPVTHGVLGYGILYLFYDADGRLMEFYRRQIN